MHDRPSEVNATYQPEALSNDFNFIWGNLSISKSINLPNKQNEVQLHKMHTQMHVMVRVYALWRYETGIKHQMQWQRKHDEGGWNHRRYTADIHRNLARNFGLEYLLLLVYWNVQFNTFIFHFNLHTPQSTRTVRLCCRQWLLCNINTSMPGKEGMQ